MGLYLPWLWRLVLSSGAMMRRFAHAVSEIQCDDRPHRSLGPRLAKFSYFPRVKLVSEGSGRSFVSVGAVGILSQRMIVPGSRLLMMVPPIIAPLNICQFKGVVAQLQQCMFNWEYSGIELALAVYSLCEWLCWRVFLIAAG